MVGRMKNNITEVFKNTWFNPDSVAGFWITENEEKGWLGRSKTSGYAFDIIMDGSGKTLYRTVKTKAERDKVIKALTGEK